MEYIHRSIEPVIVETAKTFKVLFLTGSRQVGKSTMLERIFQGHNQITFDDPVVLAQAKTEPMLFIGDNKPPLLLDEIQYSADLFPYIKMVCDKSDKKGLYILTGSQHFRLMKDVSESLAGRVGIMELAPLSLREIQNIKFNKHFVPTKDYIEARKKTAKHCDDIWSVIHRGGYPELQDKSVSWERFFGAYVKTYIERDINHITKIGNQLKFTQFLTVLAARTAQMLNYQNMADELEISLNTVKNWVSLLEATGLVFVLQPFTNSALGRAIRTPKIFFRDTGLVCYLTKWSSAETAKNGAMAGNLFETFVVSEIMKSFANEGLDYRFRVSYYRGKDKIRRSVDGEQIRADSEIDLIIEENGVFHPIEIKMTANPKAEMAAAFESLDKVPAGKRGDGAIVSMYDKPLTLRENVRSIPVDFI